MKSILLSGFLIFISMCSMTTFAEEKEYSFEDFSKIHYSIPGNLYLTQSNQYHIVLKATKEQIKEIVIQKKGNSLIIKPKQTPIYSESYFNLFKGVEIRIDVPVLDAVTSSSSGSIHGQSSFPNVKNMIINASSSGNIIFSAQANKIEAICSSSGSIQLSGKTASLILKTSSSGNIEFSGRITEYLQAETSSSGNIRCKLPLNIVIPESQLKIRSSGDISIIGKGNRVEASSSSSGKLLLNDFQCKVMKIDQRSSVTGYINVTEKLDIEITSSGGIVYQGSPRINISGNGSGRVIKLEK